MPRDPQILSQNKAILAPIGVAAINIGGQTIHSFFRFRPNITLEKIGQISLTKEDSELYKGLETLIIDEISMVRAVLLDWMETFLRKWGPRKGKKPSEAYNLYSSEISINCSQW